MTTKELPWFLANPDPTIYLRSNNYVVLDFETTALDKGSALNPDNRMLIGTWLHVKEHGGQDALLSGSNALGDNEPKRPLVLDDVRVCSGSSYEDIRGLIDAVEQADFIVCHNAKFELQWLARLGADIGNILTYDTMLGEYVRLGNRRGPKDLNSVLRRYGIQGKVELVNTLIKSGVDPAAIPRHWLKEYGKYDVFACYLAYLRQRSELDGLGLLPVLYTRCITTPVLAAIESRGLCPDPKRVRDALLDSRIRQGELQAVLESFGTINWNSSKQLANLLYDSLGFAELHDHRGQPRRTGAGNRATGADVIGKLVATTKSQRTFIEAFKEYRKLTKSIEILEKLDECCRNEGILYAQYNQAVTGTHRLSSSGRTYRLQFQNLPRVFKRLFRARRGVDSRGGANWVVAEADSAQLEFRVGSHLGRDQQALVDIRSGFDIHRNTASVLNLVSLEQVTKAQRQDAKPLTFKPLYGGRSGTPREKAYFEAFRKRYAGIYRTQTGWTYDVLRTGELKTEWGLRYYWDGIKQSRSGYIDKSTEIFNYPVQGLATAEIIPIALVYTYHRMRSVVPAQIGEGVRKEVLPGMRGYLVNTIHDSVVAEIPEDEQEAFKEIVKQSFCSDVYRYLLSVYNVRFTVPLGVETKIGKYWGEGEEWKYEEEPKAE